MHPQIFGSDAEPQTLGPAGLEVVWKDFIAIIGLGVVCFSVALSIARVTSWPDAWSVALVTVTRNATHY